MRKLLLGLVLMLPLAACTTMTSQLPAALTARMDTNNPQLDRQAALNLINQYRTANGLNMLTLDANVQVKAQDAAVAYAKNGNSQAATKPLNVPGETASLTSAGYATFADTFSGWRNSTKDSKVLLNPFASKAAIAVHFDANSTYGTYWVLGLAK